MSIGWLALAIGYLMFLFWIARWGDTNSQTARWLTSHPLVYSLALGIYCTAWTFFGAVGQSSTQQWMYLPIFLGPVVVYVFFYRFIYKLTHVGKKQHISTIADFISSRYGKRQVVACHHSLYRAPIKSGWLYFSAHDQSRKYGTYCHYSHGIYCGIFDVFWHTKY
jgi:Na+/proline symporter